MIMNRILLILLITVLVFTTTVLVYNWLDKQVQPELINLFLTACIAEISAMGGIQVFKIRSKKGD